MRITFAVVALLSSSYAVANETEPVLLGKFPARLMAVYPGDGASDVRPDTLLRMRFDAPIDPSAFSLKWDRGGFLDTGSFSYRPKANELTVPVVLGTAKDHRVVLGGGPIQSLLETTPSDEALEEPLHHYQNSEACLRQQPGCSDCCL